MERALSVEIGGTKLQAAVGGLDGKIELKSSDTVYPARNAQEILDKIARLVENLMRGGCVRGIGVGYGGPVDRKSGRVVCSHQVAGWEGVELKSWFENRYRIPCTVENDANVAALGESRCGSGVGFKRVFYLTLGSGVGGGFIINGRIYQGASPTEMEIGHIRLDRTGTRVEDICSGWSVDQAVKNAAVKHPSSHLARRVKNFQALNHHPGGEAAVLLSALDDGDPYAGEIWMALTGSLGFALSHVVHLLNPEVIVIGGGLAKTGQRLAEAVSQQMDQYLMHAISPRPEIIPASLGAEVVPIGGLLLVGSHQELDGVESGGPEGL